MTNVIRVDQYCSDGRIKLHSRAGGWSIYAAFVEHAGGQGLVRIGVSTAPLQKLHALQCGSDYAVGAALWTHVGNRSQAMRMEKALKRRFAARRIDDDWFSFDLSSPQDKTEFHSACRAAYARATGELLQWRKASSEQMRIADELTREGLRA